MKTAIWNSGHEIADTVAAAVYIGMKADIFQTGVFPMKAYDTHVGYGILRGMDEVFRSNNNFFEIDRGYLQPGHFDGYYRVSLRGTQHTGPIADWMLQPRLGVEFAPWRGFDYAKPVLIVPPTEHVSKFFRCRDWLAQNLDATKPYVIRVKGDGTPLNFADYSHVITFNSSLGWQAIQAGIPCLSDTTHSLVGSYYHNISLDNLAKVQESTRHKLFAIMSNLQLSLQEMRQGALWPLMEKLLELKGTL